MSFVQLTSPDRVAAQLLAGDFAPILACYASRVTVFMPDGVHLLTTRQQIRDALAEHRAGLLAEGVLSLTGKVVARSLRTAPAGVEFISWRYDFGASRPPRLALAAYYVRQFAEGPRIETIHYRSTAFEAHAEWHASSVLGRPPRSSGRASRRV